MLKRAAAVLRGLEAGNNRANRARQATQIADEVAKPAQIDLFAPPSPALDALREVDPDTLTPRQALDLLYRLKNLAS